MSKHHLMEEYCHCGHEVQYDRNWSDFNRRRQYVACPLFEYEGLRCTYFKWVNSEGRHQMAKRHHY